MKPSNLRETIRIFIQEGKPVLLKGAPGVGKTDLVHQAAQEEGAEVIVSHPVVSDPTDFKGMPFIVDGKADFLPFGDLRQLINATKKTVFFLDDLGQAPPSVQAAAMQLLLGRQINGHKVSDSVMFIAATNRREDKAGVQGILEPVKSRFASILELEPDVEDWKTWALTHGMPAELIVFIDFRPDMLFNFEPTRDMVNSPCPRTIAHVGQLYNARIPESLEYEIYKGSAGETFAAEFVGFLRIYRNLPSIARIILDPKGSDVPSKPEVLYALAGALAKKADTKTLGVIVTYLNRLPKEFSILSMKLIRGANPELEKTTEFITWCQAHEEAMT